MKKLMWTGVALGLTLFFCYSLFTNPTWANTIREPLDITESHPTANLSAPTARTGKAELHQINAPYLDRNEAEAGKDVRARWNYSDAHGNTALWAFTSSFSADAAAGLLQNNGSSLSFTGFGRVPYYQIIAVSKGQTPNTLTPKTPRSVTELPEPASLLLLGSGLAALAAGLRKKHQAKSDSAER